MLGPHPSPLRRVTGPASRGRPRRQSPRWWTPARFPWSAAGRWAIVGWLWLWVGGARAVDPLPPHIEAAAPEVQMEYLERTGRESLVAKRAVAQARYDERVRTRQRIHQFMAGAVAVRRAAAAPPAPAMGTAAGAAPRSRWRPILAGLAGLASVALILRGSLLRKGRQ